MAMGGLRGFTLLELVVVMALLAIITAAIVPLYGNSMAHIQLRNAQNEFVALLSFVQERAVAESREYRVYIDDEAGVYWVMYEEGYDKKNDEKVFTEVEADFGKEQSLPKYLVLEGVKPGETVVAEGAYLLKALQQKLATPEGEEGHVH